MNVSREEKARRKEAAEHSEMRDKYEMYREACVAHCTLMINHPANDTQQSWRDVLTAHAALGER